MNDIRQYFDVKTFAEDLTLYKAKQNMTVKDMANLADINATVLRELFTHKNWHSIMLITFLKLCQTCDLDIGKYVMF